MASTKRKPTFLRLDVNDGVQASISWSYEIDDRQKPNVYNGFNFILSDPDPDILSIGGFYEGKGGILKFKKETGKVRGMMQFTELDTLDGFAANAEQTTLCGTNQSVNPTSAIII